MIFKILNIQDLDLFHFHPKNILVATYVSHVLISAINFPKSTLRREGTNLKPFDNRVSWAVVSIFEDLLKISYFLDFLGFSLLCIFEIST
jgi:hypothetical protein